MLPESLYYCENIEIHINIFTHTSLRTPTHMYFCKHSRLWSKLSFFFLSLLPHKFMCVFWHCYLLWGWKAIVAGHLRALLGEELFILNLTEMNCVSLRLANKQDVQGAVDELDLVENLDVERVANAMRCPTRVETCSCILTAEQSKHSTMGIINGYK